MKLALKLILVVILLLGMAVSSFGEDRREVLRVPISPYAPWRIIEPDGRIHGVDVEVLRELCARMGLRLSMEVMPFTRCLLSLEQGECDVGTSLQRRPERESFLTYIDPPYAVGGDTCFYVLKKSDFEIVDYDDLRTLRVGVILGTKYFPRFDSDRRIKKIPAKSPGHLVSMLQEGRIDTFIFAESVGDYLVSEKQCADAVVQSPYRESGALLGRLAISKQSYLVERHDEFEHHLQQMSDDGTLQAIMDRYLKP